MCPFKKKSRGPKSGDGESHSCVSVLFSAFHTKFIQNIKVNMKKHETFEIIQKITVWCVLFVRDLQNYANLISVWTIWRYGNEYGKIVQSDMGFP